MLNKPTKMAMVTIITLLLCNTINAQIKYESGYFISNNQEKVECLIRYVEWKNNPEEFEYKLNGTDDIKTANLSNIKEFGIDNRVIYVRANVDVDINTTTTNKLEDTRALALIKKTVFLKVLMKGAANLYLYRDANVRRFYHQKSEGDISILVYKEYLNDDNKIAKNDDYKKTLWNALKCNAISVNAVNNTDYNQQDLMRLYEIYNNTCQNQLDYKFERRKRENVFNLNIRPGINLASVSLDNPGNQFTTSISDLDFDQEASLRIGLELEYILPFNKNKWSLFIEPTYNYYSSEKIYNSTPLSSTERPVTASVDYSSIEVPFGVRHYSFLSDNSRLFLNVAYIFDFSLESKINYSTSVNYESETDGNLAIGIGYNYKGKYSVEARFHTNRNILSDYITASADYKNIALIFGYTLL